MHRAICTLWRVRTVAFEASECNVLGRRERETEKERDGGYGEDGRSPEGGRGGFRARCSGQRGGLTGARVTGPHIGELSVPICLPAEKPGGVQGRRGRMGRGERDRTTKTRGSEGRQRSHAYMGTRTGNRYSREREYTLTKMLII